MEWIVLAKEEDRLLLLSRYALACGAYHEAEEDITWENCSLRSWLNGEFLEAAFSEQERSVILTTSINGGTNFQYGTDTGNGTEDAVFLLDIQEAEIYLPSDEERICSSTAFAVSSKKDIVLNEGGNSKWWLRSPGKKQSLRGLCVQRRRHQFQRL